MKTLIPYLLLICLFSLLVSGCSRKVYSSPEAERVMENYRTIAILPPHVTIQGRPKEDRVTLAEYEREDSYVFQREMQTWLQRRKQQRGFWTMQIQDVETTNALLDRLADKLPLTNQEIADALEVDAVISSRFLTAKPVSQEVAIAADILFNVSPTTHRTEAFLEIIDREVGSIWSYNWTARGGSLTGSHHQLVDNLLRNASKRMPVPKASR